MALPEFALKAGREQYSWEMSPQVPGVNVSKSRKQFLFFQFSQTTNKNFCQSRLGQKFEFSSLFFERIGDTKKTFRN